jgi:RNA polymerase sigma factor (TIGR02999 family)
MPMKQGEPDLTLLLQDWRRGNEEAASRLLGAVYGDLRRIAGGYMRHERPSHTLQATGLVHEAWMRLSQSPNPPVADREQFFRAMAAYMRRYLVDHARRRSAEKRGAGAHAVELDDWNEVLAAAPQDSGTTEEEFARLDAAIAALTAAHPRPARVLELRFFGNLSIEETATQLGIASGTVKRDFAFARSFLMARLAEGAAGS